MLNWLKRLWTRESYNLSEITPEVAARLGLVETSAGGVVVSETSLLALATLWRAARVVSEGVGNLPLKIYRRSSGARTEAPTHWAWRLVHRRPHPRMSAQDFWTLLVWDAVIYGTGVARIYRAGATATELEHVCPTRVTVQQGEYYIDQVHVPYEDLIVITGPTPDGSLGYRLAKVARESFSYYLSTERYGSAYFANSCDMGGFIDCPVGMGEVAKNNVLKSFEQISKGVDRAGAIVMLEDGCKFIPVLKNHEQSQYHETRERNSIEICKFIGVDPFLCFEWGRATWNNSKEGKQNFLTFTLNTYLNKIENELNEKVILPSEQDAYYVEFVRSALVEMDAASQAQIWALGITSGWYTVDEVRAFQGLPPKPDNAQVQQKEQNGNQAV
jgi:HK97 family phage portal protein